ncbi:CPBP family glutamic-type intramembrane protease [Microbacterium sp. zg.B96]|uniref:CPBP family glutamic-type intramembrane protease n=1 Tax=Microbacterium sp. zg.B96 TaxID=2969409 RepID=UPI00214AABD9|nr:CPBP family intramembrane glutamic endopeptidase [Microbacterium sp. zg.B96]MCR2784966.1 CPBP family intramembrane metalloprotease [Microbacterium sp. zg.B96]
MQKWREMLAAWALLSLGAGVLLGYAVAWLLPTTPWAAPLSTFILWLSMLIPVVIAFQRSRPVGLLKLRPIDALYGVALGMLLRLMQGWVHAAAGTPPPFPSFTTVDGHLPASWLWTEAVPAILVAPVLEEFFFRAVILVAVYTALRHAFGGVAAGAAAALVSTGLFIVVHSIGGTLTVDASVALGAVGLACALLVLLTGRIWGAMLVHLFYNASFIALGVVGTLAA